MHELLSIFELLTMSPKNIGKVLAITVPVALLGVAGISVVESFNKSAFEDVAADIAHNSANQPVVSSQDEAALYDDIFTYQGHNDYFDYGRNRTDFGYANDLGISYWKADLSDTKPDPKLDLDATWGQVAKETVVAIAKAKVLKAQAIIDNRDPDRGPVMVYESLEDAKFDDIMTRMRKDGYKTQADLPEGILIVLKAPLGARGYVLDETGEEVAKTKFGPLVEQSPWNPSILEKPEQDQDGSMFERAKDKLGGLFSPS